jgi:hypothetical protein
LAIDLKGASGVVVALRLDPGTERVAIDHVGLRDAGVTVAFYVVQGAAETLLPLVDRVPRPAGQVLESALTVDIKAAFGVHPALNGDPYTELEVPWLVRYVFESRDDIVIHDQLGRLFGATSVLTGGHGSATMPGQALSCGSAQKMLDRRSRR